MKASNMKRSIRLPVKKRTPSVLTCLCPLRRCFRRCRSSSRLRYPRRGRVSAFPQKQTLTYSVDWRVFPAGTAVLHFETDGDREKITATAETSGAINLLFHVSDHFQSTFDRAHGLHLRVRQADRGRPAAGELHSEAGLRAVQIDLGREEPGHRARPGTWRQPVQGCLTDLLSGIYFASSQNLVVGQSFVIPVADALHTVPVTMKVEGREELKTPLGTFKTIRVQPTADAGVVKNRGNIWIWYTDDERHLPVQMRARLFWGTITFRLATTENR